jgi:hypothetical protein
LVELYWNKLGQSEILIKLIIEEVETWLKLVAFLYEKKNYLANEELLSLRRGELRGYEIL